MGVKVSELFDLAIKMEQEGYEFFNDLAGITRNKKSREIFEQFAEDEVRHEQHFAKLKAEYKYLDDIIENSELQKTLRDIELFKTFPNEDENRIDNIHLLNAIKLGIKSEKNTIKLYRILAKGIKASSALEVLRTLILEEKKHLELLTEMHKTRSFEF